MIKEEKINGLLFQEQRTFRIYASEEDRTNGKFILSTSDEKAFLANKRLARKKEKTGDKDNNFYVLPGTY